MAKRKQPTKPERVPVLLRLRRDNVQLVGEAARLLKRSRNEQFDLIVDEWAARNSEPA